MWILFLIIFLALVIVFIVTLFKYKNKVLDIKDEMQRAKSKIRIVKAKYVQVMNKTQAMHGKASGTEGEFYEKAYGGNGISIFEGRMNQNYKDSIGLIEKLAGEYQQAQDFLNEIVRVYNHEISMFPKSIYAAILGFKKENYIDSDNLELSSNLSDTIDSEGL